MGRTPRHQYPLPAYKQRLLDQIWEHRKDLKDKITETLDIALELLAVSTLRGDSQSGKSEKSTGSQPEPEKIETEAVAQDEGEEWV